MRTTLLIAALAVGALALTGCGSEGSQPEPKKEDFQRSAPPANWRGPGQPGGPANGAPSGPPAGSGPINVPDNIKNGG
ncbi:MAG: hypothetical protein KF857_00990 [Fimbriimonadaceae bacterium]|nr:hypothetical protein [Fimbriimonadaceae bacterium]